MRNTTHTLAIERFKGWSQETTVLKYGEPLETAFRSFEVAAIKALMYDMDVYRVSLTVANLPCREIRCEDRMEARK